MAGGYKLKSIHKEKDPLAAIKRAQGMLGGREGGREGGNKQEMINLHTSQSSLILPSLPFVPPLLQASTFAAGTYFVSSVSSADADCSRPCGRQ